MRTLQNRIHAGISEEMAELVKALRRAVDAKVGLDCSFTKRERTVLRIANEAQRQLLEQELQSIADGQGSELLVNDSLYRRHQPGIRDYARAC